MKRLFDVTVSVIVLCALSPLFIVLAAAVYLNFGRPVVFVQSRPGLHGRLFNMIKFRTMRDVRDEAGQLLPDSERMTPFGAFLRSASLDELPEFWNVITGDMSIVGPRPLLVEYLPFYTDEQARRHDVRPGITGWAQINGRNAITWREKFSLDVWYVDNRSGWIDLKIVAKTILRVFSRADISSSDAATMPKFSVDQR